MEIKDIAKIKLGIDDVLVVQLPGGTNCSIVKHVRKTLNKIFFGNQVIVYSGDIDWKIISKEDIIEKIILNGEE